MTRAVVTATHPSWTVYVHFHADLKRERSIRRVGRVVARDAAQAMEEGRKLLNGQATHKRFGGVEVRRSDLVSLTKLVADAERLKRERGITGWQQQTVPTKRGRPSRAHREALERYRQEAREFDDSSVEDFSS